MVVADITNPTAAAPPRILSRAPSRSSMSRTSSRASFDVASPSRPEQNAPENIAEYLQSEASSINAWLNQSEITMTQIATSDVTDLTEILRSRPPTAGVLHQTSLLTGGQTANLQYPAERPIVQHDVHESQTDLLVERASTRAYGRHSPLLELPARVSPALEVLSAETIQSSTITMRISRETHSCLVAYYHLYEITIFKLQSLRMLIIEPDVQYIDPEILDHERDRFAVRFLMIIYTTPLD